MDSGTFQNDKGHFLRNIEQLGNNALLLRVEENGRYEPVFASAEFAAMMECTVDEAMELVRSRGFLRTTNVEDRPLVRSMLKNRVAYDGGSSLTIQKTTAKQNRIWCNVHYAFIDDYGEHYIYCTYSDVTMLKLYEQRLRSTYAVLGNNYYQINDRTLTMMRVNLTRDKVEEVRGNDNYDTDSVAYSFSEAMRLRAAHFPIPAEQRRFLASFQRESMLAGYKGGQTTGSLVLYSRRRDGRYCFVNIRAAVTRHPLTGDMIAFVTEQECNSTKVRETLMNKILAQQFDMVCYLVNGQYGVTIGQHDSIRKGNIFPVSASGEYRHYLTSQVYPALRGTEEEIRQAREALTLETAARELQKKEPYVVSVKVELEGETYYKQFDFYSIDPEAQFYILLKSDTTELQNRHLRMNAHLREALDAANQANVAKTAFLSSVSHEIRTPMNAIIGLDRIALKDPNLTPQTRDRLEKIGASASHLLGLINGILDMSSIESGRMTVRNEEFSLPGMIEEINTMIDGQCQEKGLHYLCSVTGKPAEYFIGDVMKLKQVLLNILDNAVKFTEAPGTVELRIEKLREYEGQTALRFVVRDTGIGMDKDYLPRLFEPFSQEAAQDTGSYGSTGLGMAITKGIVEMMNGTIQVESEKGIGSVFTVNIALRVGRRKQQESEPQGAGPHGVGPQGAGPQEIQQEDRQQESGQPKDGMQTEAELRDLRGRHILLAEDIMINAEIIKELLKMNGMTVEHAENGAIALRLFEEQDAGHFDAVLMDLRMPVMDGLAAARAIRASGKEDAERIPIIALTANALDEDVQRTIQAGMNAHLSKPVDPERLFNTLAERIGAAGHAAQE